MPTTKKSPTLGKKIAKFTKNAADRVALVADSVAKAAEVTEQLSKNVEMTAASIERAMNKVSTQGPVGKFQNQSAGKSGKSKQPKSRSSAKPVKRTAKGRSNSNSRK